MAEWLKAGLRTKIRIRLPALRQKAEADNQKSSLIGVVGVKLILLRQAIPIGYSPLFEVGAEAAAGWGQESEAPQSVSRPIRLATTRFRTPNEITPSIVSTGTTQLRLAQAETGSPFVMQPLRRPTCPYGNSLPSAHMRCRITASLRATRNANSAPSMSNFTLLGEYSVGPNVSAAVARHPSRPWPHPRFSANIIHRLQMQDTPPGGGRTGSLYAASPAPPDVEGGQRGH